MEMIYIQLLASCLSCHSNWLNKHVRAKYRPREIVHGWFHLFSLFQFIFKTLIKDLGLFLIKLHDEFSSKLSQDINDIAETTVLHLTKMNDTFHSVASTQN